jgi:hypothetical protein
MNECWPLAAILARQPTQNTFAASAKSRSSAPLEDVSEKQSEED